MVYLYVVLLLMNCVSCAYTGNVQIDQIVPHLNFHKSKETLQIIKEIIYRQEKGAYLRFGDGDVVLAYGEQDLMQASSRQLQLEMREAFALNDKNILKSLPLHNRKMNTLELGMFPGNHEGSLEQAIDLLKRVKYLWNAEITEVYSSVALHYLATIDSNFCIDFLKFIKSQNCVLFVGNENVPDNVKSLLWGSACKHIKTPSKNAFSSIDRIKQECYQNIGNGGEYKVIIVAMGCSGRVLIKRLWKNIDNVFFFDFGSLLDALCGWNTRAWIELTHFDRKEFLSKLASNL